MGTLKENIEQAVSDFDSIENAIEASGVDVPYGTDTSEYANLIGKATATMYNSGYTSGLNDGTGVDVAGLIEQHNISEKAHTDIIASVKSETLNKIITPTAYGKAEHIEKICGCSDTATSATMDLIAVDFGGDSGSFKIDTSVNKSFDYSYENLTTDYSGGDYTLVIRAYEHSATGSVSKRIALPYSSGVYTVADTCPFITFALYITATSAGLKGAKCSVDNLTFKPVGEMYEYVLNSDIKIPEIRTQKYPAYYDEYLAGKISTVQSIENAAAKNCDSFIFCTDLHLPSNTGYSTALSAEIAKHTNATSYVCGGDLLNQSHTQAAAIKIIRDYMDEIKEGFGSNFYFVFGNHDYNTMATVADTEKLNENIIYNLCMKNSESKVENNTLAFNYYYDNENQKIRYIVLNGGTDLQFGLTQLKWFDTTVKATPDGWTVGVFAHGVYGNATGTLSTQGAFLSNMCNAINGRTSYTFWAQTFDYSTINVDVMFVMSGHQHTDYASTTESGVPIIMTTTDRYTNRADKIGSPQEQAFDVVTVDKTARKIYCTRIGDGENREFMY